VDGASGTPNADTSSSAAASASGAASSTPSANVSASATSRPGASTSAGAGAGASTQPAGSATTPGAPQTTPAGSQTTPAAPHTSAPPPATPAWLQNCHYYSGSAEADKYAPNNANTAANKQVQCLLWYRGSKYQAILGPVGGIDGQFGDGTAKAVEAFQSCTGLSADGGVGPQTWPVLRSTSNC
jgi:peptidoglycan hydrolase-like protein with peptidoglycan-binding domain